MLPKAESAPSARASFTSWGSMALTLVASPWNFKLDAVRFWCNLAWVGHISQTYLDYIGWPSNITRQMKVWRNSKRTQLNKENLSLVANFSCLLFEVLHSVSKGWCFSLRTALVPDQSAACRVSADFKLAKIIVLTNHFVHGIPYYRSFHRFQVEAVPLKTCHLVSLHF